MRDIKNALVIARFRVQCDQSFPSFSYFADLFADLQQNMRNEENIGHIVRDKRAITAYRQHKKYLLSVNSTFIKG